MSKVNNEKDELEAIINMLKQLKKDLKLSTIVFVGFEETMQKENIDGLFKIAKENNAILRLNIYRPVSGVDVCFEKAIRTLR